MARSFFHDFFRLFFPDLCVNCLFPTPSSKDPLCLRCLADLPYTEFHTQLENPFTERFWGRVPLQSGTAFLYFEKKAVVQKLIHALKYDGRPDVGRALGLMFGEVLSTAALFQNIDGIVPTPLHRNRQLERGYNQSEVLARGMAKAMQVPLLDRVLIRRQATTTQTKKSRLERFANVGQAFELVEGERINGKHVLLVDDVLTTGATLEACGLELLKGRDVKLSMATLAIAEG